MTRPSTRFASVVRAMRRCGHWEITGRTNAHAAEIRHAESGESLWFAIHDGGNDVNAVRNFASDAGRICGCTFVEPRGRKAGRRSPHAAGGGFRMPSRPGPSPAQRDIDTLLDQRASLIEEIDTLPRTRHGAQSAMPLVQQLAHIERDLRNRHCPEPPGGWRIPI